MNAEIGREDDCATARDTILVIHISQTKSQTFLKGKKHWSFMANCLLKVPVKCTSTLEEARAVAPALLPLLHVVCMTHENCHVFMSVEFQILIQCDAAASVLLSGLKEEAEKHQATP